MNEKKKEPLFHIVKRSVLPWYRALLIRIAAIILALILCAVITTITTGINPIQVYEAIFAGAFGSVRKTWVTLQNISILLLISLALTPAFKMKFWNIGAEGQIIMGGIFASYFALFHANWNHWLLVIVMFLAGAIGGGLWGLIPAWFKTRYDTNETLFTLMLNYIALNVIVFLREGAWRDPGSQGYAKIARFNKNAALDKVFGIQFGWVIALILVAVIAVYLNRSKQGYEISVVGESQETARYAGMNVKKVVLRTMFLSGAVCGIGGMVQATGSDVTLTTAVAGGVGFTAIIVAWLAQLNPPVILLVTFLFSVLEKGSSVVQSSFGLSSDCADVLQGIILFFILGCELFIRYQFVFRGKGGTRA